jgi:5'-deoxynucleotidase YfbR-like HD superfamily hydrolase
MAMLAFAVRDTNVNRDRLIKICLVHDLAEAVVGDITPFDGVSKEDKRVLEEVEALNNYLQLNYNMTHPHINFLFVIMFILASFGEDC